ncbi:MAG TPA: T9SS type A sorting domain-containing protein [Ignavibacteria bacterium]|nr:T9SS type A sorting domain-containing protein [Ignavibacteria bacterium]
MNKLIYILIVFIMSDVSYSQWVRVTNGLSNDDTYSIAFSGNKMFIGTYHNGVYYSSNNGSNWVQTALNNKDVRSLAISGNNIIAGTRGNGIYYSSNNGAAWIQTNLEMEDVWAMTVIGSNVFAGTDNKGVYISGNNGISWVQTSMNDKDINYLFAYGTVLFAAVGVNGWGVFASPNNGASWTELGSIEIGTYSVAVSGSYIYAGPYYSGVYVTSDGGATWIQSSFDIGTAAALAVSGNNVIAGTEGYGIKVSNDNGTTWTQRSEGLGSGYIMSLCIINNYIYAGTGNGLYKRSLSEIIGINQLSSEVPERFSLFQNYPNPFNPVTKIMFEIPLQTSRRDVSLAVYDVLGNEIAVLVNSKLTPGTYVYTWDASNCPSGVYFYKLTAGDFSAVNKMILIK